MRHENKPHQVPGLGDDMEEVTGKVVRQRREVFGEEHKHLQWKQNACYRQ